MTRFGQSGALDNFQVEGDVPVRVPMMQQDNYPVKMGSDSDLSCVVSSVFLLVPASLRGSETFGVSLHPDRSDPDAGRRQHVHIPARRCHS